MIPQGAKVQASGMPNDTFGHQNWQTTSAPQITVSCKTRDIETPSGRQRTSIKFSREIQVKGPAAWAKPSGMEIQIQQNDQLETTEIELSGPNELEHPLAGNP